MLRETLHRTITREMLHRTITRERATINMKDIQDLPNLAFDRKKLETHDYCPMCLIDWFIEIFTLNGTYPFNLRSSLPGYNGPPLASIQEFQKFF
jgi:hypothetical protein